mgnify:CR=1 FL=1
MYGVEFKKLEGFVFDKFDYWPYLLINDKVIAIIYAIHGLSNGCYYGGFEAYGALANYMDWVDEPALIWRNFSINFGFIYTTLRDLYYYFIKDFRSPIKTDYELGRAFGHFYYFMLISYSF